MRHVFDVEIRHAPKLRSGGSGSKCKVRGLLLRERGKGVGDSQLQQETADAEEHHFDLQPSNWLVIFQNWQDQPQVGSMLPSPSRRLARRSTGSRPDSLHPRPAPLPLRRTLYLRLEDTVPPVSVLVWPQPPPLSVVSLPQPHSRARRKRPMSRSRPMLSRRALF
jgi:hypothetical protein